jgi:enoyl-CoA hydratase/carnithine racemase
MVEQRTFNPLVQGSSPWGGTMSASTYEQVRLTVDGDLATLTLARPEKRNALSAEMMTEITAAVREVGASRALGLIIAADGPVFSAGHNFADMAGASLGETRRLFLLCTDMMNAIQSIAQPVCAKVHALATAAGCQLVATCDLAVAASSASFAVPGGKGGLFCHTPMVAVARNIGRKRALEMALTGDPIDAETAAAWGLVNRVVPDADLDNAVNDLMRRATRGSAQSKALGKHGFYAQVDLDQAKAYDYAVELMSAAAVTADAQEGIAAFLEKRRPHFRERP